MIDNKKDSNYNAEAQKLPDILTQSELNTIIEESIMMDDPMKLHKL